MLMASDILEFMQAHGYKKAAVLGHGMGGRATMYLALNSVGFMIIRHN